MDDRKRSADRTSADRTSAGPGSTGAGSAGAGAANTRRRRRRATAAQGAPATPAEAATTPPEAATTPPEAATTPPGTPAAARTGQQGPPARRRRAARDNPEHGLRDLVGSGHSQLSRSAALRARDLNRPTPDELAEAEQATLVVHRNWHPETDEKPRSLG